MADTQVNWDEFEKSFKYLGFDRMARFMSDPVNVQLLMAAPEPVRAGAREKCDNFSIQWPLEKAAPGDAPDTAGRAGERFACNRYPTYQILVGEKVARFKNGRLVTDDPEIIAAVVEDPYFNLFIIADNPALRKLKPKRR